MKLRKQLEIVDIDLTDKKAVFTLLDEDEGIVCEVNFNKQQWDATESKYVDNKEKAELVDDWSKKYFKLNFTKLKDAMGRKMDVYSYDNFNSFWEVEIVQKPDKSQVGSMGKGTIERIEVDEVGIKIFVKSDGKIYRSNMGYSIYLDSMKKYFKDEQKERRQIAKFEEKFGVSLDDKDKLYGKEIQFEVKLAMGKYVYIDIKKPM